MTSASVDSATARSARSDSTGTVKATALAVVSGAVLGSIGCAIVALIAIAAGLSSAFSPFQPGAYIFLTVIGVLVGALGWNLIRRRAADPAALLSKLVPAVLVVSFVPDVLVGVTRALPHTTWPGVLALMIMHVLVAAAAVTSYRRFLPVR